MRILSNARLLWNVKGAAAAARYVMRCGQVGRRACDCFMFCALVLGPSAFAVLAIARVI